MLTPAEIAAFERLADKLRSRSRAGAGSIATERRGRGSELYGHEPWQQGDDLRHLDWNATLRTGMPWVRHFFDEGDVPLRVVVDGSRSMGGKWPHARRLAAGLALIARRADRQLAIDLLGDPPSPPTLPSDWYPYATAQLADRASDGSLLEALSTLRRLPDRPERLVVITDFADPAPPAELCAELSKVMGRRDVDVLHLVDAADCKLPRAAVIRAPEGTEVRYADAAARSAFEARVAGWQAEVETQVRAAGLGFQRIDVTAPAEIVGALAQLVTSWR